MTAQPETQRIPDWQLEIAEYYGRQTIQPCHVTCLYLPRPKGREWWQTGTVTPLVEPADVWRPS